MACLVGARHAETRLYEIAGPDVLTFEEMTQIIASLLGETHRSVDLPISDSRIEAAAASLVTGEKRDLLEPLMEGLHGDLTVRDNSLQEVFGIEPTPFVEAARAAVSSMHDVDLVPGSE